MKVQVTLNGEAIATATLDNNNSAKDFSALLPLKLALKDYAATEKISVLASALSVEGAPDAYRPVAGDLCYYAPWRNIAIFYMDGQLSSGLVRVGRFDRGIDALRSLGTGTVRFERMP